MADPISATNAGCETCCFGFQQSGYTVTVKPGMKTCGLDNCGDKDSYLTDGASEYIAGMPVKFDAAAGVVVPALDGVDAMGVVLCTVMANSPACKILVQRTGHIDWCYVHEAVGAEIDDNAAWWALHVELSKSNIYVRYA